jgi:hypothetical protein
MKNILIIAFLLVGVSLFAESKIRTYDATGKALAEGKAGVMSLECKTPQEWSDSCQPEVLVIEDGKIRFKTPAEKKADSDRADAEAKAKHKETAQGKLEARIEKLEVELENLKKK